MLGVEALFRFPSREIKDQILNNYEVARGKHPQGTSDQQRPAFELNDHAEDQIDFNNFDQHENELEAEKHGEDEQAGAKNSSNKDEEGP